MIKLKVILLHVCMTLLFSCESSTKVNENKPEVKKIEQKKDELNPLLGVWKIDSILENKKIRFIDGVSGIILQGFHFRNESIISLFEKREGSTSDAVIGKYSFSKNTISVTQQNKNTIVYKYVFVSKNKLVLDLNDEETFYLTKIAKTSTAALSL